MNIYVGNLSYDVKDQDLIKAFTPFGQIQSAKVITDMQTGRSKGFGFVEMQSKEEGQAAIEGLDGTPLMGRNITVNEARPKTERSGGGGGGRREGGYGGGGGGGGGRGGNRW